MCLLCAYMVYCLAYVRLYRPVSMKSGGLWAYIGLFIQSERQTADVGTVGQPIKSSHCGVVFSPTSSLSATNGTNPPQTANDYILSNSYKCHFLLPVNSRFYSWLSIKYHILQTYLPERHELTYNLRDRSHNRSLIIKTMDLTDRDFLF